MHGTTQHSNAGAGEPPAPEDASARGLSGVEAARRLREHGPNELPRERRDGWVATLGSVLREPMLLLLVAAATVYAALGDRLEAALLGLSVAIVVGLTVSQERRSQRALAALREMGSPRARVVRDGAAVQVPAREVVVGDRLLVAEGDRLAADAALLEAVALEVDESLLTGESLPVAKRAGGEGEGGRIHAGTLVVQGHGVATVVATGAATAVGRIGARLAELSPGRSPMQREIARLVRLFMALAAVSCVGLAGALYATGTAPLQALLAGITLAMANIPEEFPVVLAIFLALGAWRLARHRALVRRPAAIEALGAITTLCVDKTGTLTENRMAVVRLEAAGRRAAPGPGCPAPLADLLGVAALACPPGSFDPMDRALQAARPDDARAPGPVCREYPLRADQPAVAVAWRTADGCLVACKGAPEAVLALSGVPSGEAAAALASVAAMAADGLRVLGVARARLDCDALPASLAALPLRWCGLVAFADPLRAGIPEAIAQARTAGIRVIMLTGDHLATAEAIARQAGLSRGRPALAGARLDAQPADGASLYRALLEHDVFARVRPEHKLRLVQALREAGAVVAMTGDGVNDAPALVAADVGIAMGGRGTDVAREAAAIVLLDDDFRTIVRAIALGRGIYANIRRAIGYLLAVHVPITALALLPLATGGGIVLAPLHVVFLELVIDPACSLVFEREPADPALMRRPPRAAGARLLDARGMLAALLEGAVMFVPVAAALLFARQAGLDEAAARALAFSALVSGNLGLIARYRERPSLRAALADPNPAFRAVLAGTLLLLGVVVWTPLARLFGFAAPPAAAWAAALVVPTLLAAALAGLRRRDLDPGQHRARSAGG